MLISHLVLLLPNISLCNSLCSNYNVRSNVCSNIHKNVCKNVHKNFRSNHYKQSQAIKHFKFLKPPYLKL